MNDKKYSEVKETRLEIGNNILISMAANEEFPLGNIHRLARIMQEYFITEGFEDILLEYDYKWRPCEDYWVKHLKEIREFMRKEKKLFLKYARDMGRLQGEWRFLKKGDFEKVMKREKSGITTRLKSFNGELDDSKAKWQIEEPRITSNLLD